MAKTKLGPIGFARRRMLVEIVDRIFVLVQSGMEDRQEFI